MTNSEKFFQPLSPPPAIRLSRVNLSYEGSVLFHDLDLELPAGRVSVLLGPSGVGKSSLLRLIAGLEVVEGGGSVKFIVSGDQVSDRAVTPPAYMAQQDLLLPWLDALGNVILGQRLRSDTPDRSRARDLLARVGLDNYAHARPAALSGGMRQRVALARTLMEARATVLMDEPFSALDAVTRLRLQELATKLLRGRTILLVTHDPMEALRLGECIFIMSGRPAQLTEVPSPVGKTPRDPADVEFLTHHAELLSRLGAAEAGF
ncbi:MAG: ABC transporter ATP-binding protein [Rhodospirillaceae bacterium]|nr:ABC transporter ATP-binding protein [Rhodospirillaceae bacterium]